MFGFLRGDRNSVLVERLNDAIMDGARQPVFYTDLGVADTMDGRFEMVALHAALMVRRLDQAKEPGPALARDLTDAVFSRFEIALRETGVGDITVPKRMKKMASNYLGRAQAYGEGLEAEGSDLLQNAIARNICGEDGTAIPPAARTLSGYARAVEAALAATSLEDLLAGEVIWPSVELAGD